MMAVADGRPVVIQELSCASGYEDRPSLIGSSVGYQREFPQAFWDRLGRSPGLRAAFILDTVDWPGGLAARRVLTR